MLTSVPGSKQLGGSSRRPRRSPRGFTLLELLIVITVIALSTGLSILALRDSSRDRLEQEAARLSALLEAARMESRATGLLITWRPLVGSAGMREGPTRSGPPDFLFEPPVHDRAGAFSGALSSATPGAAGAQRTSPKSQEAWPVRWLHEGTKAEVIDAPRLLLGPEPLIPPQRVRLRLGQQQLVLATDGLGAFRVEQAP